MPNIWKSFLRPKADPYRFPDAEELVEEEPEQEPELQSAAASIQKGNLLKATLTIHSM